MAETTLRAYVKEIDSLIENEQLDEAIAHCRHSLEQHPKHLETYRLLGKAYLEAKRYGDAADIFQRVLSAVPDDFVAHIGMAIVREDEGNLDSAIWHMERAFETNPANPAIQQELRRLIGRRDGLEPHKVRMTRGALGRMYAHGELFPQGIAELRAALDEDPDRPDLQVLLASMYWRTDQHAEAADVCNVILENLPYCRDANMIMASVLQEAGKTEEATVYHRRLVALNPYAAFVERAHLDPKTVDAKAVRIDKLDWKPGQAMPVSDTTPPAWAASLGVDLEEEPSPPSEPSDKPPWLEELEAPEEMQAMESPEVSAMDEEQMPVGEGEEAAQIPDWMREAGWQESTGEAEEAPVSFSDEELSAAEAGDLVGVGDEEELAPADIPGWLQDIAPSAEEAAADAASLQEETEREGEEDALPPWMAEDVPPEEEPAQMPEPPASEAAPTAEDAAPVGAEEGPEADLDFTEPPTQPPEETPGLPTWLEDETPGATSTIVTWLGDREAKEEEPGIEEPIMEAGIQEEEPITEAEEAEEERLPGWLDSIAEEGPQPSVDEPEEEPAEAGPGWLEGVAEVAAQQDLTPISEQPELSEDVPQEPEEGEVPEWLASISEREAQSSEEAEEPAPDWLAGIGESEEDLAVERRPSTEDAPEWLRGISEPGAQPEREEPREEAPDWMQEREEAIPPAQDRPERETAAAPDWLSGIEERPSPLPEEAPISEEEAPDWLMEEEEPTELEAGSGMEEGPVPDWLAGIEEPVSKPADEPAAEMEVVVPPEEEIETVPSAEETAWAEEPLPAEEVAEDDVLEWLDTLAAQQEDVEPEIEEARVEGPPEREEEALIEDRTIPEEAEEGLDWLDQLASKRGIDMEVEGPLVEPTEVEQPPPPAQEPEPAFETPPQKQELALEPQIEMEEPEAEPEEGPGVDIEAGIDVEEEPAPTPTTPTPEAELFPTYPEPRQEEPGEPPDIEEAIPDWLLETSEEAPPPEPEWSEISDIPSVPEASVYESPPAPEEEEKPSPEPAVEEPEPGVERIEPQVEEARLPEEVPAEPVYREEVPHAPEVQVEAQREPEAAPTPQMRKEAAEPEPMPAPEKAPARKPSDEDAASLLEKARQALAAGDLSAANEEYARLIKRGESIQVIVDDLRTTLERDEEQPALWQTLGDAYMKDGKVPEAVQAYQRGMESL